MAGWRGSSSAASTSVDTEPMFFLSLAWFLLCKVEGTLGLVQRTLRFRHPQRTFLELPYFPVGLGDERSQLFCSHSQCNPRRSS